MTIECLLIIMVTAIGSGLVSDLYSFCLGDPKNTVPNVPVRDGRILSRFGQWLVDSYHAKEDAIEADRQRDAAEQQERDRSAHYAEHGDSLPWNAATFHPEPYMRTNWWKMTGVCPRCFNAWFATSLFVFLMVIGGCPIGWWFLAIPFLGFSNLALSVSELCRD